MGSDKKMFKISCQYFYYLNLFLIFIFEICENTLQIDNWPKFRVVFQLSKPENIPKKYRKAEYVQRHVCFVNVQLFLH